MTGNSFNIMTLGGLSLSIGLLVDIATITVENIHRNRALGKPLTVAILDGAAQISLPVIMATLAICIVFFPVVLLEGPGAFSVRADGAGGRDRDARGVLPLAHAGQDALAHAARRRARARTWPRRRHRSVACERTIALLVLVQLSGATAASSDFRIATRDCLAVLVHTSDDSRLSARPACSRVVSFAPAVRRRHRTSFRRTDAGLMKLHFRAPSGNAHRDDGQVRRAGGTAHSPIVPADELGTINSHDRHSARR